MGEFDAIAIVIKLSEYWFRSLLTINGGVYSTVKSLLAFLHGDEPMLIGELAQRTGISRDTIRFYEKMGLISAPQRQLSSGYKEYDDATVERLTLIAQAKALGFTLNEIREEVDVWQSHQLSQAKKIEIMQTKIAQIDAKIQQLGEIKILLMRKLRLIQQEAPQ